MSLSVAELMAEPRALPAEVAKRFDVHLATVFRWFAPGGCAGVRLESYKIGSKVLTTWPAVERFAAALTAARNGEAPPPVTTRTREKQKAAAAEKARALVG
jgi:hypothetical protein